MRPISSFRPFPSLCARLRGVAPFLALFLAPFLALFPALLPAGPAAAQAQDGAPGRPGYVGSAACAECHTAQAAAWQGSHHALAWTEPGPDTVIADFDGTAFAHDGMTARFRQEGAR